MSMSGAFVEECVKSVAARGYPLRCDEDLFFFNRVLSLSNKKNCLHFSIYCVRCILLRVSMLPSRNSFPDAPGFLQKVTVLCIAGDRLRSSFSELRPGSLQKLTVLCIARAIISLARHCLRNSFSEFALVLYRKYLFYVFAQFIFRSLHNFAPR